MTISTAQAQRLFAIATSSGWQHSQIKAVLLSAFPGKWNDYDSISTRDLLEIEYEQICSFLGLIDPLWMQAKGHTEIALEFFKQQECADFNCWLDFRESGLKSVYTEFGLHVASVIDEEMITSAINDTLDITQFSEGLNDGQKQALNELIEWWDSPGKQFHCLQGYAGTGKTYLLSRFLLYLQSSLEYFHPLLSAAWHKPLSVLTQAVNDNYGSSCTSGTLYSLFGLRLDLNEQDGKNMIIDSMQSRIDVSDFPLLIIDEVGVCDELLTSKIQSSPTKTLLLGDPFQLPPVGESISPVFDFLDKGRIGISRLTQIERYDADSGLGRAVNHCLQCLEHDDVFYPADLAQYLDDGTLVKATAKNLDSMILSLVDTGEYDKDQHVILAFSNASVIKSNAMVREALLGKANQLVQSNIKNTYEFLPGEEIVFNEPLIWGESVIYTNGDRCNVIDVEESYNDNHSLHQLRLILPDYFPNGKNATVTIVRDRDKATYEQELQRLYVEAIAATNKRTAWGRYHGYRLLNFPVRHTFASTIHKSQGSTYSSVYAKMGGISKVKGLSNEFICRLWYVALSRAKTMAVYSL